MEAGLIFIVKSVFYNHAEPHNCLGLDFIAQCLGLSLKSQTRPQSISSILKVAITLTTSQHGIFTPFQKSLQNVSGIWPCTCKI